MTNENGNNKWKYIFKNSVRDFVLMAMISISMISILVVSNMGNENTQYMIKQQAKDKIKDDADQKAAEAARATIIGILGKLNHDVGNINMTLAQTKLLLNRLLLFEDQIHNENLIKFQKLDKLIADLSNGINLSKSSHDDIKRQLEKNIDGTLEQINTKLDDKIEKRLTEIYTKMELLVNSTK